VKPCVGGLLGIQHCHKEFLYVETVVRELFHNGPFFFHPLQTTNLPTRSFFGLCGSLNSRMPGVRKRYVDRTNNICRETQIITLYKNKLMIKKLV
jgi:hypothetical protein